MIVNDYFHNKKLLVNLPFFSFVPDKDLKNLFLKIKEIFYKKNNIIFSQDTKCKGFYIVKSGKVKIYKISQDGREHIIEIISPGKSFALVPVLDKGRYPAFASTLENSALLFVSNEAVDELIKSNPNVSLEILKFVSNKIRDFTGKLEDISLKTVTSRLAGYIIKQSSGRDKIILDLTYETIANHLGTVREVISRALTELEGKKVIKLNKKEISIINRPQLKIIGKGVTPI